MRRQKSISVVVRAPSRGLVSRLPGESADFMPSTGGITPGSIITPGQIKRAASHASNVRYENGVVRNAPGYEKVLLSSGILTGLLAAWKLDEAGGTRADASGNGHDLALVPGNDPLDNTGVNVSGEAGKFAGAALFEAMSFRVQVEDTFSFQTAFADTMSFQSPRLQFQQADNFSLTTGLGDRGFQNPRVQWQLDGFTCDTILDSGIYFLAAIVRAPFADAVSCDTGLASGAYVPTIVFLAGLAASDALTLSTVLDSGTYTLTIVPGPSSSDALSSSTSFDSGTATKTVFTSLTLSDSLTLTTGLDSGSYG